MGKIIKKKVSISFSNGKLFYPLGSFDGNFWWSHLKYLKLLKKPIRIYNDYGVYDRSTAESWVINISNVVKDYKFSAYAMSEYEFNDLSTIEKDNYTYNSFKDLLIKLSEDQLNIDAQNFFIKINKDMIESDDFKLVMSGIGVVENENTYMYHPVFTKIFKFYDNSVLEELMTP